MALRKLSLNKSLRLQFPDTLDFLAEMDMKRYRLQRRLIGTVYQTNSLKKFEHGVDDVITRTIAQLKSLHGAEIDLKEWMHIIVVECLGAVVLSWSPGFLKEQTDRGTSAHAYLGWRRKSVAGLFPVAVVFEIYFKSFGRLFSRVWGVLNETPKKFKPFFPVSSGTLSGGWNFCSDIF